MAYVNVAEWKAEQVTEWLKGLDSVILPYLQLFLNHEISGQQLLNVRPEDLELLGVKRLGHQELILEAVEHLRNFHYELDRENLQLLALKLSCQAHSLHNELRRHTDSQPVSTQTLADVASVVRAVKPLVCWLDRSPFSGQLEYADRKCELLRCSLEIATCAQRDRFAERPVEEIRASCGRLAKIADGIIQDIADPLILQPASLDLATLRKRGGDDLGFFIVPSFHGIHQIGEIKFGSPAHQCGKVEEGDEVVQVNYQTVVGWQRKKVFALFEESITDVLLTLKKRPRHTKVYGQIYMKPYRLPSKKRAPAYTRWHENLPSPRPELLTIPDFEMPLPRSLPKSPPLKHTSVEPLSNSILSTSSESDDAGSECDEASLDYELEGHASPTSMRLYLPKPRVPVQRRATITGASPTSHRPPVDLEKFFRELKLEKKWKGSANYQDYDDDLRFLRNKSPTFQTERPSTCLGFEKSSHKVYLKNVVDQTRKLPSNSNVNQPDTLSDVADRKKITVMNLDNNKSENPECNIPGQKFCNCVQSSKEKATCAVTTGEKKEKRFVTRLELVVDCSESRIEFCKQPQMVKPDGEDLKDSSSLSSLEHCSEDVSSTHSSEKARKISTESQLGDLPSYHRERGRLDKSFSTPAYDLSGLEGLEVNQLKEKRRDVPSHKLENKNENDAESRWLPAGSEIRTSDYVASLDNSSFSLTATTTSSKNKNSQENLTLGAFKHLLPTDTCHLIGTSSLSDPGDCDQNSNPVTHGRVVETINRHLLDSRLEKDDFDDDFDLASVNGTVTESPTVIKCEVMANCPEFASGKTRKCEIDEQNGNQALDNCSQNIDCNQNTSATKFLPKKPPRIMLNTSLLENINKENDLSTIQPNLDSPTSKRTAPVPPVRLHNVPENSEKSPVHLQPKVPCKISVTAPEPPPRPVQPSRSPSEQSKSSSLRAIIISKSGVSKPLLNSPRVARKKNPFLAKRRVVGVKELGAVDYQGWLYRRLRLGGNGAQWIKGWFILKATTFYGFKTREANKADCFISLPGFTISPAEEVKSKKFAFKVYHTGTVFYFAAESEEELAAWLDCLSMATLALDLNTLKASFSEGAVFSETEDEGDETEVADSCFPSPKMRKFTNFLSGHSSTPVQLTSTPSPKPARSHQNLASSGDSKSYDIQKKFGSLKKLGYRSKPHPSSSASSLSGTDQSHDMPTVLAPHSLDRKYLRFLSSSKNQNVPVPTAQFRSYRRVAASENCQTISGTAKLGESSPNNNLKIDSNISDAQSLLGERSSPSPRFLSNPSTDLDSRRSGRGAGAQIDDVAGLLTLEQFMLLRQEEERQQIQRIYGSQTRDRSREVREQDGSHRETHEAYAGYTEDPVSSLQRSQERRRAPASPAARPVPAARTLLRTSEERPAVTPRSTRASADMQGCRESVAINSCKHPTDALVDVTQRTPLAPKQPRLKNAALYQPPPVAFPPSPTLGPSFEMHLDHRGAAAAMGDDDQNTRAKGTGSKLRQLFSPKHSHSISTHSQIPEAASPVAGASSHQKTLLGSPRLHRALFRHGDSRKPKVPLHSDSSDTSLNSPTAGTSTSPISSPDWIPEYSPSPKPTMGVAMLGKKPTPMTSASSNISSLPTFNPPLCPPQMPACPPPDYPGLEYPPVFEPGTYSLSDTSSLLCQTSQVSSVVYSPKSEHASVSQFHHR